jgi:hypothetical protein
MKVENVLSPPAYNTTASEGTSDLTTLPLYTSDQYPGGAINCSPYRHGGGSPPYRHGGGSPPPPPYPGCSEGTGTGTALDDIHMEDDEGKFSLPLCTFSFLLLSTYSPLSFFPYPFFIVLFSLIFLPLSLHAYFLLYSPSRPSLYSQPLLLHPNSPYSPPPSLPPPSPSSTPHPTSFLLSPLSLFLLTLLLPPPPSSPFFHPPSYPLPPPLS